MSDVTDMFGGGAPPPPQAGVLLSLTQFADECGMTRRTISERVQTAALTPAGRRGAHPVYRLRDLMRAVYFTDGKGDIDPSHMRPHERRAHNQAELIALTLQMKRGELVPSFEVEARQAELFKIVTEFLETLPDVIERDCGAPPLLVARVEKRLDDVRAEMYARIVESAPENVIGPAGISA